MGATSSPASGCMRSRGSNECPLVRERVRRVTRGGTHINFTVQRRRYRWKMRRMRACYRWRIVGVAVMSCSCGGAVRSVSDARASCPWHHRPPRAPGHRYTSRARRATRHTRSRSRERARCSVFWSAVTVIRVRVSASYPAKNTPPDSRLSAPRKTHLPDRPRDRCLGCLSRAPITLTGIWRASCSPSSAVVLRHTSRRGSGFAAAIRAGA